MNDNAGSLKQELAGALCYLTFVPAIIFLVMEPYKNNAFIRFHAYQSIFVGAAIFVVDTILGMVGHIVPMIFALLGPIMGLAGLAYLAMAIVCALKAYANELFKIPIVGELAARQAQR